MNVKAVLGIAYSYQKLVLKSVKIKRGFDLVFNKAGLNDPQVEQYVEAVVKKDICIESTYQYVIAQENEKAVEQAVAEVS